MISEKEFKEVYFNNLGNISEFVDQNMLGGMSQNDKGYERLDLIKYYEIEWKKYYHAYRIISENLEGGGKTHYVTAGA